MQARYMTAVAAVCASLMALGFRTVLGQSTGEFSSSVDANGIISIPADFRRWAYLDASPIAGDDDEEGGAAEFHVAYTQPETIGGSGDTILS